MVPPCSDRISRVPPYSRTAKISTRTGLSPAEARLSRRFRFLICSHWPGPRSLATTSGVSVDVLSSGYLDVSVPRVCSLAGTPYGVGCPIRKSPDQSLFAAPRRLSQRITSFIASCRQGIHRMPLRHLITLIINVHLFPAGAEHLRETRSISCVGHSPYPVKERLDPAKQPGHKPSIYKTSFLRSIQQPCGQAGFLLECRTLRLPAEVRRSSLQRCQEQAAINDHRKTVSSSK